MTENRKPVKTTMTENCNDGAGIIKKVIDFLQLFIPITLAKRLVAIVLLAAGIPTPRVTELSGLCDRTVRGLLKSMREGDVTDLFAINKGSGLKSKACGLEAGIMAGLEKDNYRTRQQIADMIKEKFHVQVSVPTVGRLLKKTALKG